MIIGITHGDINGVGYEVIIKAFLDNRLLEMFTPVIYGSPKVAAYHRKALNITNFSFNNINNVQEANLKRANIIDCLGDDIRVELGKPTEHSGEAAYKALECAVKDMLDRKFGILVTAPVHKNAIQSENFSFPGHTEYLQEKFAVEEVLMLMVSDKLKVGVVTGHVPLKKVPSLITKENIARKLRILNRSLIEDFGIRKPRIAVLGLNPHSGDNGLIGTEENDEIMPVLKAAREKHIVALGPYPADGFFGSGEFLKFDAVLAMYHDQGLAPFKALSFNTGVNYTAGLPIIRTSPAHGTAYDIAGNDQADPSSFREAIYLALDIYHKRIEYKKLTKNPLPEFEVEENTNDKNPK